MHIKVFYTNYLLHDQFEAVMLCIVSRYIMYSHPSMESRSLAKVKDMGGLHSFFEVLCEWVMMTSFTLLATKKIDCVIVVTGESTIPLLDVLSKYAMT